MYIRSSYLENVGSLGDAETKVWNLSYQKPITAIDIKVQATTAGTGTSTIPLPREITNISIVDGALTVFSMIMSAIIGLLYGLIGAKPQLHFEAGASKVNEAYTRILFGRYFGDREYFLDPNRFNNLQLKLSAALTIHANNFLTNTGTVTIIVHTIENGAMPYKGCFMSKEVAAPTLAAAADQTVDLPVDYPYAQLTLFPTDGTVNPDLCCSDAKLSVDNDSKILFNYKTVDIIHQNAMQYGAFDINNDEFLDLAVANGIGVTDTTEFLRFLCPFGAVFVPMGLKDEGDFYVPNRQSTNRLILTGGATGGKTRVILSQIYQ